MRCVCVRIHRYAIGTRRHEGRVFVRTQKFSLLVRCRLSRISITAGRCVYIYIYTQLRYFSRDRFARMPAGTRGRGRERIQLLVVTFSRHPQLYNTAGD